MRDPDSVLSADFDRPLVVVVLRVLGRGEDGRSRLLDALAQERAKVVRRSPALVAR